jgi:hypothetical protein
VSGGGFRGRLAMEDQPGWPIELHLPDERRNVEVPNGQVIVATCRAFLGQVG